MFAKLVILKKPNQTNKMKTNWIILVAVLVGAIALVISLIIRNKKDEKEVMKSFNAEDDIEGDETAQQKGKE
jgi:CHASE1-domain containing sensor protein